MNPQKKTGFEQINLGSINPIQQFQPQSFTLAAPQSPQGPIPQTTQGTGGAPTPGQQTDAQRAATFSAAGVAPSSQAAPVSTGTPTIASLYGDYQAPQSFDQYMANGDISESEKQAIRTRKAQELQAEIDATTALFTEKLNNMRRQSSNTQGQLGAIQARRGLLGSDFGAAQSANLNSEITANENDLAAQKNAAINRILTQGKMDAENEIQKKIEARSLGYQNYVNYLKEQDAGKPKRAETAAQRLLAAGINPAEGEFSDLAKTYGVGVSDIVSSYNRLKLEQDKTVAETQKLLDQQAKEKRYVTLSDGATLYDTETGQIVAQNEKNFAPQRVSVNVSTGTTSPTSNTAFKTDMDALVSRVASGITSLNQRNSFLSTIKQSRNDEDKIRAISLVAPITADGKNDIRQQTAALKNLDRAISMIDNKVQTGVLKSAAQYTFNLAGKDYDPNLAQLSAFITASIQPYRNSVTGAAWGQQEESEYQNLFGSTKYSPTELKTRLSTLRTILRNGSIATIQASIDPLGGGSQQFEKFYEQPPIPGTPPTSVPTDQTALRSKYNY